MPNKEAIKGLIELADDAKEADKIIVDAYGFKTVNEKLAFLHGLYDFTIIGGCDGENSDPLETDYISVLATIVNKKWRA